MTLALVTPTQPDALDREESIRLSRLFEGVGRGDRLALRELYDATSNRLMGIALRLLKDETEAADVLQEVYLKLWQQKGGYSGYGTVMGWLVVVTRNASLDRLRSRRRKREELRPDPDDSIEDVSVDTATTLGIQTCLNQLNDHAQEAIVLSYIHGYSHQELQERLSRPLGTIKAWIRRGLQELKQCLEA